MGDAESTNPDNSTITFSIDDTTNYAIDPTSGVITLTTAGAKIVNDGGDLPDYKVSAASSTGDTGSIIIDPTNTTDVDDGLTVTVDSQLASITEGTATTSTIVGDAESTNPDNSTITFSIDDTTNYAIDPTSGVITLTTAGAKIVNDGGDLPDYQVSAASSTGDTGSIIIDPVDTDVLPEITINDTILTNDSTPTFSGTSQNTDGNFMLNVNGKDYAVTPAANGTWSFTIPAADALEDGDYTATISGSDAQGNNASANDALTVDADAPDINKLKITDIVDTNGNHSEIIMSGTADEAGNTIKLYDEDDNYLGSTTVLENGTWSFDITNLENTPRNDNEFFKVTETDGAGNVTAETPAVHFNAFTWNNAQSDDFDDYALAGSGDDTFTVNDNDVSNRIVFDGGDGTDTVILNGNRDDFDISVNDNGDIVIVDNTNTTGDTVIVRNTEVFKFDDGVFNDETVLTGNLPEITINDIGLTNDDTPTFSGTSQNTDGDFVLSVNGKDYNVTPESNGTWVFIIPAADALADGNYTATINGSDGQGNQTSASDSLSIDATAPDINDLKITDIVDNEGDYSSVTMKGTGAEVGNTITLYDEDGNSVGNAEVQENGTWNISIENQSGTPVNDNEFYSVTETDSAGNTTAQTNSTHYWHGSSSNINTESSDDYVMTGSGNDRINTDDILSGTNENGYVTSDNDDTNDSLVIDAGDGTDTVSFGKDIGEYTITTDSTGNVIVTESIQSDSNDDGKGDVTELRNVETIEFKDGTYDVASAVFTSYNVAPDAVDDNTIQESVFLGTKEEDGSISQWGAQNTDGSLTYSTENGNEITISATRDGSNTSIGFMDDDLDNQKGVGIGAVGGNDAQLEQNETVTIDFGGTILAGAEIGLAGLGGHFVSTHSADAKATWEAYDNNGNVVASGELQQDDDASVMTNSFTVGVAFSSIEFSLNANINSNFTIQYVEATYVSSDITTQEDTSLIIQASDLLANDTDANGDTITITNVTASTNTHGTVSLDDNGNVIFTPEENYSGLASFTYTISDGNGKSDTATVTVQVNSVNDAPVIDALSTQIVAEDGTLVGQITASDAEGDTLSFVIKAGADIPNGLIVNTDGTYTFDAGSYDSLNEGQYANILVPIVVSDGNGGISETTLNINVTGLNNDLTYVSESAGYSNVVGYYEVDVNGNPISPATIVIVNQNGMDSGTHLSDMNINPDTTYGFFIIANGSSLINASSEITFDLSSQTPVLLINGSVSTQPVYHDNPVFNNDGKDHFLIESDGNGGSTIKIEDLENLGDTDFNDVVLKTNFELTDILANNVKESQTKTYDISVVLGDEGSGNIKGDNPSDTFSKEFDFGKSYANETVLITLDTHVSGTWNKGKHVTDDTFSVKISGNTSENEVYKYGSHKNKEINEDNIYTYEVQLDEDGKVKIDLDVASTEQSELITINSITVKTILDSSYKTPIILDLDNDGIETISLANGVKFDIDNDGDIDLTGWVGADDGLLVRDINKDGIINDASELFGEETIKEDGSKASDGYDALRELDSNEDGIINNLDDAFSEISVWKDSNSDGITDEGELLSLEEAGVAEISLGTITSTETSNGNIIGLKSTYTNTDGEELAAADVWFQTEAKDLVLDDDIDLVSAKVEPADNKMALNNQNVDLKGVLLADEEEYIIFGENENSISLQDSDLKWVKQDENEIIDDEEFKVFESTFSPNSHIKIFIDNDIDVDL